MENLQKKSDKKKFSGRKLKSLIHLFFVIVFFSKVIFLESGIFASAVYFQTRICECNHSSGKENHSFSKVNIEDNQFKSNKILNVSVEHKDLPNCHSAKNNEVHKCSCSKKKSSSNALQSQMMNPSHTNTYTLLFEPNVELLYAFASDSTFLLNGHSQLPEEPPRNSIFY